MSKKFKYIILSSVILLAVLLGGMAYYVSTLLSPEEIKRVAIAELEKVFPKGRVELGKIKVGVGLSAQLKVTSLSVTPKSEDFTEALFSVEDIDVRIPYLAILRGGGSVEINISEPRLAYHAAQDENNWSWTMEKKADGPAKKDQASSSDTSKSPTPGQVALPAFALQSEVNLNIKGLVVQYKLPEQSGAINIQRLVLKNMNLKTPSAFEIDSAINLVLESGTISFSTLVIGEFDLSSLINNEDLSVRSLIKIRDLRGPGFSTGGQSLNLTTSSTISPEGIIQSDISGELGSSSFKMSVLLDDGVVNVSSIDVSLLLAELMKMSGQTVANLNLQGSLFKLTGSAELNSKGLFPDLAFEVAPAASYTLNGNALTLSARGSQRNEKIELYTDVGLLGGKIETATKGVLNVNDPELDLKKMQPMDSSIVVKEIKLTRSFLQSLLYPPVTKEEQPVVKDANKKEAQEVAAPIILPRGTLTLQIENVVLDDKQLNGNGKVLVGLDRIVTDKFKFNYSEGEGSLTHTTNLVKNGEIKNTFNFQMNKLNLAGLDAFLPPVIKGVRGIFTGSAKGEVDLLTAAPPQYKIDLAVSATQGEIVGLNLSGPINQLLSTLPILQGKIPADRTYEFDESFETLLLRGKFTHQKYDINRYEFKGIDNKVEVKGEGFVSPMGTAGASQLTLTVKDNTGKISEVLQKNVGMTELPVRLVGQEFGLKPDIEYTLSRVAKSALKNEVKKRVTPEVQEKVEQKVDEQINRLKEQGKEQLNKLFRRR